MWQHKENKRRNERRELVQSNQIAGCHTNGSILSCFTCKSPSDLLLLCCVHLVLTLIIWGGMLFYPQQVLCIYRSLLSTPWSTGQWVVASAWEPTVSCWPEDLCSCWLGSVAWSRLDWSSVEIQKYVRLHRLSDTHIQVQLKYNEGTG